MSKCAFPLEAVTKLNSSLLFGSEFLGLSRPATIGGVDVRVHLPDFEFVGEEAKPFSTRLPNGLKLDWPGRYENPPTNAWHPFGQVTSWNPNEPNGGIKQFTATRLLLVSKNKVTEAEAQKLLHAVDKWRALLDLWIEVVVAVDLMRSGVDVEHHGTDTDIWLNGAGPKDKTGKSVRCKHVEEIKLTTFDPLSITRVQWREILAKASAGNLPPEAYVFIRDARRELNDRRYRRSVLDAATAAEVALAKLRDDELASTDPKLVVYVQEKARQLGNLVNFHKAIGRAIPERIVENIATPRNRAIHQGKEPEGVTAAQCLQKAEEVVDLVFPRRKLL